MASLSTDLFQPSWGTAESSGLPIKTYQCQRFKCPKRGVSNEVKGGNTKVQLRGL